MRDLSVPAMRVKAGLFVLAGLTASCLLLVESPSLKVAFLLAVAVWSFARAYYFVFHVMEHYIDGEFRFAGFYALARAALRNRRAR